MALIRIYLRDRGSRIEAWAIADRGSKSSKESILHVQALCKPVKVFTSTMRCHDPGDKEGNSGIAGNLDFLSALS